MERFWKEMHDSTNISGIIAVGLVFTSCYMAIAGIPIPETISAPVMLVVGFLFGSKVKKANEGGT